MGIMRGLRENTGRFSNGQQILQVDSTLDFKHLSLIKSDIQKFMVRELIKRLHSLYSN